jgi:hypothetical protein
MPVVPDVSGSRPLSGPGLADTEARLSLGLNAVLQSLGHNFTGFPKPARVAFSLWSPARFSAVSIGVTGRPIQIKACRTATL